MITLKKISWTFIIALILVGCGDGFLNVDSRESVEKTDKDVNYTPKEYVTGVYGEFTDFFYAFSWLGITEMISDNANDGSTATDTGVDKERLDNFNFTSASISVRGAWRKWYKTIGRASYTIDYIKSYKKGDQALKSRLIGETRFLRALSYFYLVRSFGDIPLQHVDITKRAPKEDVYAFIISDLDSAIAVLPQKSQYAPEDLGRVTKGAARTLLAKVYLQLENWTKALEYVNLVINTGEYSLEPNYVDIWKDSHENGVESIFEIQARGKAPAIGIHKYSTTQGARGPTGWGWGFNVPSQNLIDAYKAAGDLKRMNATIIFPGETLYDGRYVGTNIVNRGYNQKAYSSLTAGAAEGAKNIRVLRYGEVLLIKAEAANELGKTSVALTALNKVRARVELNPITITAQDALRQLIYRERRFELAFEHKRWFTLQRTGQAKEAVMASGNAEAIANFDEHFTLFPIPLSQLRKTPMMEQNPGY